MQSGYLSLCGFVFFFLTNGLTYGSESAEIERGEPIEVVGNKCAANACLSRCKIKLESGDRVDGRCRNVWDDKGDLWLGCFCKATITKENEPFWDLYK